MFWYLMSTIMMALCGVMIYIYYLRKGQFDDPEDVKYQMFRDDNEETKAGIQNTESRIQNGTKESETNSTF